MGCDIHLYIERRENGKWVTADRWQKSKYNEPGDESLSVNYEDRFYSGRNYGLFAILADVRNGRGFAGVKTGEGYNPISEPKGIPEDACELIRAEVERWDGDGHSHSYFTVAELMEYDWTQFSWLQGWVNGPEFEQWNRWARKNGRGPECYCGAVSGQSIRHVSVAEMEKSVEESPDSRVLAEQYCLVEWTEPYYSTASEFLSQTLPRLWRLGKPEDVRIVFFFDN